MFPYIVAALLLCLVVVRTMSKSCDAAFANLGLIIGLALGLSESPVLAATITAIFALVGILVPIYLHPHSVSDGSEDNKSPSFARWMRPLTSWLVAGLILGVWLRANDALNFSKSLRAHYLGQGFSEAQVDKIMDGQALALSKQPPSPINSGASPRTNLHKDERNGQGDTDWEKLLADMVRPEDSPEKNLDRVKKAASVNDQNRIKWLETQGMTIPQILEALKTLHTGKETP